ncbi:hypothetical protein OG895_13165 [Streptomyces sp. NBC_00201]|uniref:hypothetical protein n=1 Tax=unclassified Streptomyces TaxID=2593676 RepID=UPI0022507A24|nr:MULTISPECIES: hypothetical protein [unclassified Streptomyces]MCX5246177.1 hypothetical protein [Streptomyces sp. NBC_00201]
MKDTAFTREERSPRPVALQTPFQTPAIDRNPTAARGTDGADADGVEANINVGDILGTVAKFLF